jgi:hypothetical protein
METTEKQVKLRTTKPFQKVKGPLSLSQANSIFALFFGHRFEKVEETTESGETIVKKIFNIDGVKVSPKELCYHLDKGNLFKIHHIMTKYGYEINIKNESLTVKHKDLKVTVKDSEFPEELTRNMLSHKMFFCYALAISRGMEAIKKQKMENPTPDV